MDKSSFDIDPSDRESINHWLDGTTDENRMIWAKATAAANEACAKIADARAMRCEEAQVGADEDDKISLRSLVWQFSVLAADFRTRRADE